jgi:hypothetical protein
MATDSLSPFLGMTLQATGNNNNAWGTILNGSALQTLERGIRGNIVRSVTGGTLDLSANPPPNAVHQALDFIQIFQGTLTANQIVILPNLSACWKFVNETTGSFQLLLQTPSGTFVNIPQGCSRGVTCDGAGNLLRDDRDQVGNFEYNAVPNAGTLAANGASVLRTDFPDLYAKYGTTFGSVDSLHFTLPLLTDTGRFLRSTTSTLAVGTYQANQNLAHTHAGASFSGTTSGESNGHTHTGSGTTSGDSPDHTHIAGTGYAAAPAAPTVTGVASTPGSGNVSTTGASTRHTHTYSLTTSDVSSDHTHTYSGTTGTIPSSGGSEARPEALAVVVSIRY